METCDTFTDAPSLVLFFGEPAENSTVPACPEELWPLPLAMVQLFEQITGWVLAFEEYPASFHRRRVILGARASSRSSLNKLSALENLPDNETLDSVPIAEGRFKIVDMSATWPAGRPTSHRAKCDQFVEWLNDFLANVNADHKKLSQAKSILAATVIAPEVVTDHESLEDTFVPRHAYETRSERDQDFVLGNFWKTPGKSSNLNDLQTLVNEVHGLLPAQPRIINRKPLRAKTETLPHLDAENWSISGFASIPNWRIGGRRGMLGNRYIDWVIKDDGCIELMTGHTGVGAEPSSQPADKNDWETTLILNPVTDKFWIGGDLHGCYWIFDPITQSLTEVPEKLCTLKRGQAIVVSTANRLNIKRTKIQLTGNCRSEKADHLAKAVQEFFATSEPVLVLARIR